MADGERNGLPLVQMRDAWKVYGEKVQTLALREPDLDVRYGEFSAIIGPSGSGKSTLLHLIGALDRLTRGVILYPFDLSLMDWPERAAKAGADPPAGR